MKTAKDKSCKTPNEDLMNEALRHYEEAANAIHHFNSDIPKAIKAYFIQRSLTDEEIIKYMQTERGKILNGKPGNMGIGRMTLGEIEWYELCLKTIHWARDRQKGGKP